MKESTRHYINSFVIGAVLGLALIKIDGANFSWFWVFSPIWMPLAIGFGIAFFRDLVDLINRR